MMSWEISYSNMCRACMKIDGVLISMYDDDTIIRKNLPHKLAELTSIKIDKFDGLPTMLCAKCAYRTDAFYDFKQQVQSTDVKLRKMFEIQGNDPIKDEEMIFGYSDQEYPLKNDSIEEQLSEEEDDACPSEEDSPKRIMEEKNEIDDTLDKNSVFLPIVEELDLHKERKFIKNELPDEISDILKSPNFEYTIMYIPEDGSNEVAKDQLKTDNEPLLLNNDNLDDDNSTIKVVSENSESKEPAADELETSDSDSDYFLNPKDNILGSLNDAITKIKEIKLEDKSTQYQCTLCLQNYDKLTGVLLHTIDNHVPSSGPFFCVVCEKDCESHKELRGHVKTHTGQFPYSCFICRKAYTKKRYLKRHMVCHTDFPRHRCSKCGKRFSVKSELESHLKTHNQGAPYACSQCPRLFNHKGNYKRHLISHLDPQGLHLPKFPCKECGKRFLNNRMLQTHIRVHTGEKPFKCDVCGRSFSQQGNLLNHLKIHSNPRSYTCEVCGKRFNQRATLRDHSLLHTGEKPHVCNVCGIAFTFSAALRRHMWTHAGGKPFGCEICNARFVGKYDLRRHMNVHSGRPKTRRKKNLKSDNNENGQESSMNEESIIMIEEPNTETVFIEHALLNDEVVQVVTRREAEKENVDALFNLIQYG